MSEGCTSLKREATLEELISITVCHHWWQQHQNVSYFLHLPSCLPLSSPPWNELPCSSLFWVSSLITTSSPAMVKSTILIRDGYEGRVSVVTNGVPGRRLSRHPQCRTVTMQWVEHLTASHWGKNVLPWIHILAVISPLDTLTWISGPSLAHSYKTPMFQLSLKLCILQAHEW